MSKIGVERFSLPENHKYQECSIFDTFPKHFFPTSKLPKYHYLSRSPPPCPGGVALEVTKVSLFIVFPHCPGAVSRPRS